MPELPTFGEAGLTGYEAALWYSLLAPAKTPEPIVEKLNAALVRRSSRRKWKSNSANKGSKLRPPIPRSSRR